MIRKIDILDRTYRPGAIANAGLLVGGISGAFGGLFAAAVGALLGFMVDRVRTALARVPEPDEADRVDVGEGRTDPRSILGLGAEAGPAEIRRAWRRISKECHPDTGTRTEDAARRFREAREAYEALLGSGPKPSPP